MNTPLGEPAPRLSSSQLGRAGEDIACAFLTARGLHIVARNWRCRHGELDLVARRPGLVVIGEVKTRRGHSCGEAAESVTPDKLRRLRTVARCWLAASSCHASVVRFDVVVVEWSGATLSCTHYLGVD